MHPANRTCHSYTSPSPISTKDPSTDHVLYNRRGSRIYPGRSPPNFQEASGPNHTAGGGRCQPAASARPSYRTAVFTDAFLRWPLLETCESMLVLCDNNRLNGSRRECVGAVAVVGVIDRSGSSIIGGGGGNRA